MTDESGVAGSDSIGLSTQIVFASTKEVIQANKFTNSSLLESKVAETGNSYVKSPAGIFTAIHIPYDEIAEELKNDTINSVNMVITNYEQENEYVVNMKVPSSLLLIRAKDVKEFFEGANVRDNILTYIENHNASSNNTYTFSNIARLITTTLKEKELEKAKAGTWTTEMEAKWEEDNKLLLIPVVYTGHTDNYSDAYIMDTVEHNLEPTYAKLIGGPDNPLQLRITYTTFE